MSEPEAVPHGALQVVLTWCAAVDRSDFEAMWQAMDANLRLTDAQLWVGANLEHPYLRGIDKDELAADLAQLDCDHELRPAFEEGRVDVNRAGHLPPWPLDSTAWASHRRIVGEDLDIVILLDRRQFPEVIEDMTLLSPDVGRTFLVRFSPSGWLVAGFDYQPPMPGWPPTSGVVTES